MRFETVAAMEMGELREDVEKKCDRLLSRREARVIVDVDFFVDNTKLFPYRAVIKYR